MDGQVPFYGLELINGDARGMLAWKGCAHIKKARLHYNGRALYDLVFPDTVRRWSTVAFDPIMIRSGDVIMLEILELHPHAAGDRLAIAEVKLMGAH